MIDATGALARIDRDLAAILRPRQNQREHLHRVVRLPLRFQRKFVAPIHENPAGARIGKRLDRRVTEFLFDLGNLFDVIVAGAVALTQEILGCAGRLASD